MQKWEYKKTNQNSEAFMNELGEEGWELVVLTSSEVATIGLLIFKRPKQ